MFIAISFVVLSCILSCQWRQHIDDGDDEMETFVNFTCFSSFDFWYLNFLSTQLAVNNKYYSDYIKTTQIQCTLYSKRKCRILGCARSFRLQIESKVPMHSHSINGVDSRTDASETITKVSIFPDLVSMNKT